MGKCFNITGICYPERHYMVNLAGMERVLCDWENTGLLPDSMDTLSEHISDFCQKCKKPVVLMVDEVDKSSDNQLFLSFLGMLRNKYLQSNYLLAEEQMESRSYQVAVLEKNQFLEAGQLNMDKVLEKFCEHFQEIYGECEDAFLEENGRRLFLLYLKPIINGIGNYYIEAQTRDMRRTDIIVDYKGKQYVIEMKIWRGEEYNHRGEQQLREYLEYYRLEKGYMISPGVMIFQQREIMQQSRH